MCCARSRAPGIFRAAMASEWVLWFDARCSTSKRALALHPRILERPILVAGDRAIVARPAERVLDLLPDDAGGADVLRRVRTHPG